MICSDTRLRFNAIYYSGNVEHLGAFSKGDYIQLASFWILGDRLEHPLIQWEIPELAAVSSENHRTQRGIVHCHVLFTGY